MSENGEIYTAGKKFYTAAGSDGIDKYHLCLNIMLFLSNDNINDLAKGSSFLNTSIIYIKY